MNHRRFASVAGVIVLLSISAFAKPPAALSQADNLGVPKSTDYASFFDANRLFMMVSNVGHLAYDSNWQYGRAAGLYYPYTGYSEAPGVKTMVYGSGMFMGGKVNGQVRIAAAEYSSEFTPGPMAGGTYQPDQPSFRVYKIDASSGPGDADYDQWPASEGAPLDQYGNPLLLGDQTLWAVFNDANPSRHTNNAGSTQPLGVEVQQTVWGSDVIGEQIVVYVKYKLYNRSTNPIDSFFVSFWADPDLGDVSDDQVGCDTLSDIFFAYNTGVDAVYAPESPVWGGKLLSGPVVPSVGDTAEFDGHPMPGFKNVGMYSFSRYVNGSDPLAPLETFNYMKGRNRDGSPVVDPYGNTTRYSYSGNPANGTGWLDTPPSDKRLMVSFGPVTFNPGDSQQVVLKFAAYTSTDMPPAVTELKRALDSAAVEVGPPQFAACDSARLSVNNYQKLGDVYFVSTPDKKWLAGMSWGGGFFGNSAGYASSFFGSMLDPEVDWLSFHNVEVRFSTTQTQKAYHYLRGGSPNYGYDGYSEVPFTVWDTDNNRQLNAAFVEQNGSTCHDGSWSPCNEGPLAREYLLILNSDYSGDNPYNTPIDYTNLNFSNDAWQFDGLYMFWPLLQDGFSAPDIADGQKLVFAKQTSNVNGPAGDIVINQNVSSSAGIQELEIAVHSGGSSILKYELSSGLSFSVSPNHLYFDTDAQEHILVSFLPSAPGSYTDVLRVVDVPSGSEMARVNLSGNTPSGAFMEIAPNPMYVYFVNAIDPIMAKIHIGNFFIGGHPIEDVDLSSLLVNDAIVPTSVELLPSYDGFDGKVLEITFPVKGFIQGYGLLWDVNSLGYEVRGQFTNTNPFNVTQNVIIIGRRSGDANNDGFVDIADGIYLVSYIFSGGAAPAPLRAGDADCDGSVCITDVVYLVNYIFGNGPEPCVKK